MNLFLPIDTSTVALQPEPKVDYPMRQLLTTLPTPGHFLLVIDNSSLEVFTTCPKSADYKLVRRREAHARNAALTFGGALHEGLEKFLRMQWFDKNGLGILSKDFDFQDQDQAIVKFFTENPAPPDEYRTVQNALAVLSAYRQRATLPDYQWEIMSDENGPIIERAFELPLGVLEVNDWIDMPWLSQQEKEVGWDAMLAKFSPPKGNVTATWVSHIHIAWSGRIDAVARCGNPNVVRLVDHKTTSQGDNNFVQDFKIGNQVLGYAWAAKQLWPDLNPTSFCLNAIYFRKPAASHKGRLDEKGPKGGDAPLQLFRAYFEYTDYRIEQWSENVLHIVSDFIHSLVRGHFCRHTKWCFGKYGKCQYHDVCVQDDPKVRSNMLNSDLFKPVTWNPVAGR